MTINYSIPIDICRFVAYHTRIFSTPIPQPFWHIQKSGGLRGHVCETFCGDIGYIHRCGVTTYNKIKHRKLIKGPPLCDLCAEEFMDRLEKMTPKPEPEPELEPELEPEIINETCRPEESK